MNTEYSKITIQVDCPAQDAERYRQIIPVLILNGSLNIKGGRAIIDFDYDGNLMKIAHEFVKWTKKFNNNISYKPSPTK